MPAATINRLLERLTQLPAGAMTGADQVLARHLREFRRERETVAGPISEEQWRGILLSAIDLLDADDDSHLAVKQALNTAIYRVTEDNAA